MTPQGASHPILAVDPGLTTGLAYMEDGKIIWTGIDIAPWDDLRRVLKTLGPGSKVVCESGPMFERHHREALNQIESIVKEEAENVIWVQPAQWKNTPASRNSVAAGTQHEKDAASIAHWYDWTQKKGSHGADTA